MKPQKPCVDRRMDLPKPGCGLIFVWIVGIISGRLLSAEAYKPLITASKEVNSTIYQVANKTLLCRILNGTCTDQTLCYALQVSNMLKNQPMSEMPNFTCHDERTCCFHDNVVAKETRKIPLETIIGDVENKTMLCQVVGGQCIKEDLCQILHVRNLLLGQKIPQEKPEFNCSVEEVCCFANKTRELTLKPRANKSPTPRKDPQQDDQNRITEEMLTSLFKNLNGRPTNFNVNQRSNNEKRRRPLYQRERFKNSYDYDYYDDYNGRDGRYRNYDYYDRPIRPYRTYRRRSPPREPPSRLYRNSRFPRRRQNVEIVKPNARSGYAQRAPKRRYRPKVTKKVEYHDHDHGKSLLNHGLGGIFAKGFEDVFVSNLTAFCELYDGVCVEPGNCATQSGKSYDRFQCNATTLCCLPDYSIKRLHPLGQKSEKTKTGYKSNQAKEHLLSQISPHNSALFTQTDRETLCDLKKGECLHPSLCNSHKEPDHHGYGELSHHGSHIQSTYSSHQDFYCNLTTICCTPSLYDVETHVEVVPYDEYH